MEFQASRFAARVSRDGRPILLGDQDRTRWDGSQIQRGRAALRRADAVGLGRGSYALQAAIVELNRAVALSMTTGPAGAMPIVERLAPDGALRGSHLLPSVRGELLAQLGHIERTRAELLTAAELVTNHRERAVLRAKANAL